MNICLLFGYLFKRESILLLIYKGDYERLHSDVMVFIAEIIGCGILDSKVYMRV